MICSTFITKENSVSLANFRSPNWKLFNQSGLLACLPACNLASQPPFIWDLWCHHCTLLVKKREKTRTLEREKNKNKKAFSIIGCAWNYKSCRFLTMWRPGLPNTTLAISWQVLESFMTTSHWPPDQGFAVQCRIPGPRSSKSNLLSWKIPRNKRTWYFDNFC